MRTILYVAGKLAGHAVAVAWLIEASEIQVGEDDEAVGIMTKNEKRAPWVSLVRLNPKIVFGGDKPPAPADEKQLHHLAHEQCFIANSIKTEIVVQSG